MSVENLDDDKLQPIIQEELEQLNNASMKVNELENKLSLSKQKYQSTISDQSEELLKCRAKQKKAINRSRPFFELKKSLIDLNAKSQDAVKEFETACHSFEVAKKTLSSLEERAKSMGGPLDQATQDLLNQSVRFVQQKYVEKQSAQKRHEAHIEQCKLQQTRMFAMQKRYKSDISKAEPYFASLSLFDRRLKEQKERIETYERHTDSCKQIYAKTLARLEELSNQIHEQRREERGETETCVEHEEEEVGLDDDDENTTEEEQSGADFSDLGPRGEAVGAETSSSMEQHFTDSFFEQKMSEAVSKEIEREVDANEIHENSTNKSLSITSKPENENNSTRRTSCLSFRATPLLNDILLQAQQISIISATPPFCVSSSSSPSASVSSNSNSNSANLPY